MRNSKPSICKSNQMTQGSLQVTPIQSIVAWFCEYSIALVTTVHPVRRSNTIKYWQKTAFSSLSHIDISPIGSLTNRVVHGLLFFARSFMKFFKAITIGLTFLSFLSFGFPVLPCGGTTTLSDTQTVMVLHALSPALNMHKMAALNNIYCDLVLI